MQLTQLVKIMTSELQVCMCLLFECFSASPEFAYNAQNYKDSMFFSGQSKSAVTEARIEVF